MEPLNELTLVEGNRLLENGLEIQVLVLAVPVGVLGEHVLDDGHDTVLFVHEPVCWHFKRKFQAAFGLPMGFLGVRVVFPVLCEDSNVCHSIPFEASLDINSSTFTSRRCQ